MTWRGSSSLKDRIFSCLVYTLPLVEISFFGIFLFAEIPPIGVVYTTLLFPFFLIYSSLSKFIPFFGLILFFVLFFCVVRNERLRHFLRFNTMQSLLLSIFATLCQLVLELLGIVVPAVGSESLFVTVGFNLIFLAVVSASVYSIFQCIRGIYAEIPMISEAAYAQVR
jgi:Chloroplast import apparatus Tic20-like